jgi:putative transposase
MICGSNWGVFRFDALDMVFLLYLKFAIYFKMSIYTNFLTPSPYVIESIFPQATIQTCVVHLVRHSLSFVNYKDRKMVAADLQLVYQASTEAEALQALEQFQIKWDKKYPVISRSWRANWARVKPMFELPMEIRRVVYTTNVIESLNFSLRKIIKGRNVFPNDELIYRLIYLGLNHVSKKWTMPIKNWKTALQQFAILYENRLPFDLLATSRS